VEAARSRGTPGWRVVLKYPTRIALNPFLSTVGWTLPALFSGTLIVSVVLNLPTIGPLLLEALRTEDMYMAGSLLMILSFLTLVGTLISDVLLAWSDPRIRLER
jgi:peptide/nickel transport system permease protein